MELGETFDCLPESLEKLRAEKKGLILIKGELVSKRKSAPASSTASRQVSNHFFLLIMQSGNQYCLLGGTIGQQASEFRHRWCLVIDWKYWCYSIPWDFTVRCQNICATLPDFCSSLRAALFILSKEMTAWYCLPTDALARRGSGSSYQVLVKVGNK